MERLYHETNGMLQQVHMGLSQLERASDESAAQIISQGVHAQLRTISENCDRLDILVNKEPPTKRHMVRVKVDQLKSDAQAVNLAISTMYARLTCKWQQASAREELLKQRFRPNESTALSIEHHELLVHDRLQSSNNQVDDLLSQGMGILENLRSQHMDLKGVRRKMMDIGGALGLSNTTLQMIDRRVREDWFVFVVGCIVTLVFMYAFYRFWKG